ncbi:Transposase (plasmid) [Variovorax sp. RA8]|nr:Transposase [Variovorax sp. RA8]VTU42817.1 Transposase [Variovorax sp. RA8]
MEARQVKNTLAAMRNKTDRNDARGIARILRTGWYSDVRVKSMHSHRVRALLASLKAILKKCGTWRMSCADCCGGCSGSACRLAWAMAASTPRCDRPSPRTRCWRAR